MKPFRFFGLQLISWLFIIADYHSTVSPSRGGEKWGKASGSAENLGLVTSVDLFLSFCMILEGWTIHFSTSPWQMVIHSSGENFKDCDWWFRLPFVKWLNISPCDDPGHLESSTCCWQQVVSKAWTEEQIPDCCWGESRGVRSHWVPLLSVTSMTILSLGPGAFRPKDKEPPSSGPPPAGGPPLLLKLGELDLLMCVGVEHGVRLGLSNFVRTVRTNNPLRICCKTSRQVGNRQMAKTHRGRREEMEENKGDPMGHRYLEGVNGLLKRQTLYWYAIDI